MKDSTTQTYDYQEAVIAGMETMCGLLTAILFRVEHNKEPTDKDIDVAMLQGVDMMWTRYAEQTGKNKGGEPL